MSNPKSEKTNTIGIFNETFPPIMDGVSLTVKNYGDWLYKMNQPVCVVTPKSPNYSDNEPYPVYRYTSVPIIGRKPYRIGLPDIDRSFKSQIGELSFGLVHAHSPFSAGRLALNISKKQKIPFVATFHSKFRDDFQHSVRNKYVAKQMTNEIIRFFEKADEVWIPQASVEETIREYGFRGHLEVVNNGNDFASDEPVEPIKKEARLKLKIDDKELMFLFVGQHIWEKNTRLIVESLALIKDLPFKMFFIGTGYAKDDLVQLVDKLGLNSKVEFIGVITDRAQLKQYYAAADLFLFPSIYDNAPLVVREAGAMETASVLIAGASAADIITDNFNGFLINNSSESFAEKLRELIASPENIRLAGINASKTITRSWESVTEEVLDRYQTLMKKTWKR